MTSEAGREKTGREEACWWMVENIRDSAIFRLDLDGRISSWNDGAQRLLGYAAEEILGRPVTLIFTPEDNERERPAGEMATAREKGIADDETWHVRRDGIRIWVTGTLHLIRGTDGEPQGFVKVMRDDTRRREAEEEMRALLRHHEQLSRFTTVLEEALDMEHVLQKGMEVLLHLFRAERAFLAFPLDPGVPAFRVPFIAEGEDCEGMPKGAEHPMDEFHREMARLALSTPDPVVVGPETQVPGFQEFRTRFSIRTLAIIALRPRRGKPWMLGLHQCHAHRGWSPAELKLLQEVAARLTPVLDNLLLHRELKASEWRFRWLVEHTPDIVWRFDLRTPVPLGLPEEAQLDRFFRDGYLAECNDSMARAYGYGKAEEILGFPLDRLMPPEEPGNREYLRSFIRAGFQLLDAESQDLDRDGRVRIMLNNLVGIMEAGALIGAWGTSRDITERRQAELELRRSRDQLESILQRISDAIVAYDGQGQILYVNEAASRLFDIPLHREKDGEPERMQEVHGRLEILDESGLPIRPDKMPSYLALKGQEVFPVLMCYRKRPGGDKWLSVRSKPILDESGKVRMVITIAQDLTALRRTEEQFRQAQKQEAIGRLAGGIAHDFNNLLTAVNGYCELLLDSTPQEDARRSSLEEIQKAGARAAALTNQLLVYSRRQIVAPKVLELNSVLQQLQKLLQRTLGEDVELTLISPPSPLYIKADQGQIEQIVLNLAINAKEAMPDGGLLTLELRPLEIGPDFIGLEGGLQPGPYVLLVVADSGVGMDESTAARIFEPFFTTKRFGQSSGLGLATVYGIVKQSGGEIVVESSPGQGTVFKIYFPRHQAPPDPLSQAKGDPRNLARESGVVLLAEDEESVRRLVAGVLRSRGYEVLEAEDGLHALEVADARKTEIDLLLTDVVMRRMGGRELADRLKADRPGLRVIFMSGYTDDAVVRHGVLAEHGPFLQKPFSPQALLDMVREVLSFRPATP